MTITRRSFSLSLPALGMALTSLLDNSRAAMISQRHRQLPFRWVNINKIDPEIAKLLMKGQWHGMIPTR